MNYKGRAGFYRQWEPCVATLLAILLQYDDNLLLYSTDDIMGYITCVPVRVPTIRSKDILHQAKGGSSWLSPVRSDGSLGGQVGGAGLVGP
jgi:hypothetical protein